MPDRRYLLRSALVAMVALAGAASTARAGGEPAAGQDGRLSQAVIGKVIGAVAVELREGYVFPDKGAQAADALERALGEGAYAGATDPVRFARQVTDKLRETTRDGHVRMIFGSPFGNQPPAAAARDAGFEVERLEGNVGMIRLDRFAPPDIFRPAADNALRAVADTRALIVDIRENGGGHPASVAYLVSHFLEGGTPVHINSLIWRDRGTDTFRTETFRSSATPVRYRNPVYVLVGPETYSAGEEFAYDMQALRRAVIVGGRTRGGANPGGLTDVGDEFFVVVPTGRAENPITKTNWEGVGVLPDVEAAPEIAQTTAIALAKG